MKVKFQRKNLLTSILCLLGSSDGSKFKLIQTLNKVKFQIKTFYSNLPCNLVTRNLFGSIIKQQY